MLSEVMFSAKAKSPTAIVETNILRAESSKKADSCMVESAAAFKVSKETSAVFSIAGAGVRIEGIAEPVAPSCNAANVTRLELLRQGHVEPSSSFTFCGKSGGNIKEPLSINVDSPSVLNVLRASDSELFSKAGNWNMLKLRVADN